MNPRLQNFALYLKLKSLIYQRKWKDAYALSDQLLREEGLLI